MDKKIQKIIPFITIILMVSLIIFYLNKSKLSEQLKFNLEEEDNIIQENNL